MSSPNFRRLLAAQIEPHLIRIHGLLGSDYKLTLIARNATMETADVILTADNLDLAIAAAKRTRQNGEREVPGE